MNPKNPGQALELPMAETELPPLDSLYTIGKVTKPHGLRGELVVALESDFPQWLAERPAFYAATAQGLAVWRVERARHHQGRLILKVDAVGNRNQAEAVRGTLLLVTEADARAASGDPEYYLNADLIGLRVVGEDDGQLLGQIHAIIEMPAQNLLEVQPPEGPLFLVPFVDPIVVSVQVQKGEVRVRLPDGLIDINR